MKRNKKCTKCGKVKSLDDFYKDKNKKDGHSYLCKQCCKEYSKNSKRNYSKNNKCEDCGKKITNNAKKCVECAKKLMLGNKNPSYIDGKSLIPNYCTDCGKLLSHIENKRCWDCYCIWQKNPINSPLYIDGRSLKKYYCKECGNVISYGAHKYGTGLCHKCSLQGKRNPGYIDGRTPLNYLIRHCLEYKEWINQILKRDNYTCQECNQINGKLEVHHKKTFAKILSEFLQYHNNLNPVGDKYKLVKLSKIWKGFWDLDNGITLCENCHKLIYKRSAKNAKK